jgi:hypothetical protein
MDPLEKKCDVNLARPGNVYKYEVFSGNHHLSLFIYLQFSFHCCADPDEISDHKRKFIAQIRKGIAGKIIVTTVNRNPDPHQAEGGVHAECQ